LTTELCAQEGFVQGDRNQLKQLFLHLALNAKDDMPAGGELRIETSIREIDPGSDAARHYRPGRYVQLQVSDSGEGMDEKTLAHVFEPFFSTKASGSGAGLALSIVHSIIAQNGGYIRAESQNNRGTTFEMMLPCVGTFQGLKGLLEPAKEEGPVPTILLVEDEDGIRRLMHSQLEREGYQLLDARNAEEAELIAKAFQDPINVLVTDIVMPGMSGVQLAECLKRLRPEMKMLFVSGYRHDVLESYGLPNEGADFLSKPYPAHELLRRVRKLGTPEASASERAS
jgi:CheY-like chemotaxis protein